MLDMALLELQRTEGPAQRYPLSSERIVLGRHPECDIVLDVGAVSRQHAQIRRINGEYFIEDLHSRNGTLLNDAQVNTPTRLQPGDRLKICEVTLTFVNDKLQSNYDSDPGAKTDLLATIIDDAAE